ncbi:MAG: Stp1/IreP family PP2C-type Ser/Thr phosphatase [Myxococcales bacterium]|nr:Stp1/IreP family PP2C-type Ser/Thr phosphatase [Myxococcales bacterium]
MRIDFWASTDVGKQRDHNEDNFLVDKNLNLFVVADGMGGHAAGEVASSLCVRRVREAVANNRDLIERFNEGASAARSEILRMLEHAVQAACSAIYQRAQKQPEKRGMGTTCTLLLLAGHRGFIAHVGDSRIYLLRQGQTHQLSEDHSLVNELVRRGKLKLEEIDSSPYKDYKNAVTRAVGVYESVEVDTLDFDVLPGDQFMLCSDGLHHYLDLDETKIGEILTKSGDVKEVTSAFVDLANEGGGHDNITSVVVRVQESEHDERSKEVTLKIDALKRMPIFRYLNYKELVRVMNITEVHDFDAEETIIEEGSPAQDMFIILEGKVRLHKDDSFITNLEPGDHFGEMAMVDSAPRSASASAAERARLLVMRRSDFYDIIRDESQLSVKLLWSFVQVLAQRLRKTTADLSGARLEASLPDFTDDVLFDDN